jgi:hypothetical protein
MLMIDGLAISINNNSSGIPCPDQLDGKER